MKIMRYHPMVCKKARKLILILILCSGNIFWLSIDARAIEKDLDFSSSVIIAPAKIDKVELKAVRILQEEIYRRTGIQLNLERKWPGPRQPVIAIGQKNKVANFTGPFSYLYQGSKPPGKEGFQIQVMQQPNPAILVVGTDARGVLYGVGHLLRQLMLKHHSITISKDMNITTAPHHAIRGHQLGYRPKTNAYDAWGVARFDQYIRELAIFGANSIEIIPPRTDDDPLSIHMKIPPLEMLIKQAEIIDSYGLDVWLWYPNMGQDYSQPDSIQKELNEREEIFKRLKRIDVVFVPGGDPGDLHPDILFAWLEKVADVLQTYHPMAKIWVSPQAFRPTQDWLDAFYHNVNQKHVWFGGVVFGPWVKTPLPELRQLVHKDIPFRHYPDITHSISCQYPVNDWDLAFAMTLGRECYNPRPVAQKIIHNALDEFASGSISYSEGINDDVNKFVWSSQDWNHETPVIEVLRDYARFFIGVDVAEGFAQGLLALERNWQGALISNENVDITLKQWQDMEKTASASIKTNYRFQMGLLRAYYDAYIQQRLIYETELQRKAYEILRTAKENASESVMQQAEAILQQAWDQPVARDYRKRCEEIADFLFNDIGSQLSVKKHNAVPGRGNFMDYIDIPLNDAIWLLAQFKKIRQETEETRRVESIDKLLNWKNPGPGGFYDNLGHPTSKNRLDHYPAWQEDPGSLKSPRVSFGVGLRGEEWVHTVEAKGFDGSATPLAWMHQLTTLYEVPLTLVYQDLEPNSTYELKVAYTGRFRSRIKLLADDTFLIHDFIQTGITPIMQFPIPPQSVQDGKLRLTWTCGEGERGAQVAEVWLIKK